jgi:hypothetical protein
MGGDGQVQLYMLAVTLLCQGGKIRKMVEQTSKNGPSVPFFFTSKYLFHVPVLLLSPNMTVVKLFTDPLFQCGYYGLTRHFV